MTSRWAAIALAAAVAAVPAAVGTEPRTEEERYRGQPGPRPTFPATCELDLLNTNPVCFPVTPHDRGGTVRVALDDDAHDLSVPARARFVAASLDPLAEHRFCDPVELPVPADAALLRVYVGERGGPSICPTGVIAGTAHATFVPAE